MKVPFSTSLVTPRARSPLSGELLPLEDIITDLIFSDTRSVRLVGRGKSTAIEYLQDMLTEFTDGANPRVRFLDNQKMAIEETHKWDLTVFASSRNFKTGMDLRLETWGQDEVIEYLIAKSPGRCKSVMARLGESNDLWLGNGSPRVLSIVLDLMIGSDEIKSVEQAIQFYFDSLEITERQKLKLRYFCMKHMFDDVDVTVSLLGLTPHVIEEETVKFLSSQTVRYVIVTQRIVENLHDRRTPGVLKRKWPVGFIQFVASKIKGDVYANEYLNDIANKRGIHQASNAASLLVQNDADWTPSRKSKHCYDFAKLQSVSWQGVQLPDATLINADLSFSNLLKVNLQKAIATSSNFQQAKLAATNLEKASFWRANFRQATMRAVQAHRASFKNADFENAVMECSDFSCADFTLANLKGANLSNCNLNSATFSNANLSESDLSKSSLLNASLNQVDFRTTKLEGASFVNARLKRCNFEDVNLDGVELTAAFLDRSLFTGSRLRNCKMQGCRLRAAKLADIDWEDCDLKGADFTGCHFHMGSTRSGTLDSPYPSHGTRTGYYTDDYDDHYFKRPEEIRKANLCGCDLSRANVYQADFYLVDLRGAKYNEDQEEHFQRCGAILRD